MEIKQYNEIKKGTILNCSFDSVIRKNTNLELTAMGKSRTIKSSWAQSRVILKKEGSNFKCFLYLSKENKISLALGNLATSNLKINI